MADEVQTDPSIGDLRAMLSTEEPAAEPKAGESTETPAPDAQEPEGKKQEPARGADGKFRPAADGKQQDTDPPGVAKRIGKALEEKRLAEERAAQLERELEAARSGSQPAKETAPAAPLSGKPKPQEKDYDSYAKYIEDLTDWKVAEARAADAKAASDRAASESQQATAKRWTENVAKAMVAHADYEETMQGAMETPITPAMHMALLDSERGPEVAYFLAKNAEETARIAKLNPLAAAREIGKIESKLDAPAAAAAPARAAAKPPAKVGGGASPHAVDLNDEKLSIEAFNKELRKRLKL